MRILIWERGVGPTSSSGTGSCASLVAAAAFGGAARDAEVIAPGGTQRVEWRDDSVYLTGWAEVLCEGDWLRYAADRCQLACLTRRLTLAGKICCTASAPIVRQILRARFRGGDAAWQRPRRRVVGATLR